MSPENRRGSRVLPCSLIRPLGRSRTVAHDPRGSHSWVSGRFWTLISSATSGGHEIAVNPDRPSDRTILHEIQLFLAIQAVTLRMANSRKAMRMTSRFQDIGSGSNERYVRQHRDSLLGRPEENADGVSKSDQLLAISLSEHPLLIAQFQNSSGNFLDRFDAE